MNLNFTFRFAKRTRFLGLGLVVFALGLFVLHQPSKSPPLEPLQGLYQYFSETDFHSKTHDFGGVSHVDTRFIPDRQPSAAEVRQSLQRLLKSSLATMNDLKIETWLSHGALLGWYWNQRLLPWDTDLDFQMSWSSLKQLATNFNMTEFHHSTTQTGESQKYLLDINPHYSIVSERDLANKIDARWIETSSGKFIDITAVHETVPKSTERSANVMFCKDGHKYQTGDIYPLTTSIFEGEEILVPHNSRQILEDEYGKWSLTNKRFHWYRFSSKTKLWEPE